MISAWQQRVPDVWTGEDGNLRILLEIDSAQIEGLYVANQLLLEDMFIQSASLVTLNRFGIMFGLPRKLGTQSQGPVLFTGNGGEFIAVGTRVAYNPGGGGDLVYFDTIQAGTLPNPGAPTPPRVEDAAVAGNLTGTYEWAVSFVTAAGESLPSPRSNALILTAHKANLSNIPIGGPGTVARRIYRSTAGDPLQLVTTISNNTDTTYIDNVANTSLLPTNPQTTDNSAKLQLLAQSVDVGSITNIVIGAITELISGPPSLISATNPGAFTGGSDEESIDDFRNRLLNYYRNPQAGSPDDLKGWAEEIDGVEDATVFPNFNLTTATPGHVTVRIAGPNGSIPPQTVIDAVAAFILSKDLANITVHITTFTVATINPAVTITPATGFTTAQLRPNVQQAIVDYVNSVPVGGTVYISRIIDAVIDLAGVLDVVVTAPATNQSVDSVHKFVIDTTYVTVS